MKILKPGKVEQRKFVCPKCGCVFVASEIEMGADIELMVCPQEGCHYYAIGWDDGEPYKEPARNAQPDKDRLETIFREGMPDARSYSEFAEYLIAHGVTFKEDI